MLLRKEIDSIMIRVHYDFEPSLGCMPERFFTPAPNHPRLVETLVPDPDRVAASARMFQTGREGRKDFTAEVVLTGSHYRKEDYQLLNVRFESGSLKQAADPTGIIQRREEEPSFSYVRTIASDVVLREQLLSRCSYS